MSFLGKSNTYGIFDKQKIVGDSVTSIFNLKVQVGSVTSLLVVKNGSVLEAGAGFDYTISGGGTQIVFSDVPDVLDNTFIIFLGKELSVARTQGLEPAYETQVGNGSQTTFTLTYGPLEPFALIIFVDRVLQRLDEDYTVSGNDVEFTVAPDNLVNIDFFIHGIERSDAFGIDGWEIDIDKNFLPRDPNQDIGSLLQPIGNAYVGGDVLIQGNLTVNGSSVILNTTELEVEDNKITLNKNFTSGSPSLNIGLDGRRGDDPDTTLRWNEVSDVWECGTVGDIQRILREEDRIISLNTLTAQNQTFATGSTGTDFNIASSGSTHTFHIPSASAANRGLVTTAAQTFAGAKTFNGQVNLDYASVDTVAVLDSSKNLISSSITTTELNYLGNLTENVQDHFDDTTNPHSVTATQVGLSAVTNDAQLKRDGNDFTSFASKASPVGADIILIEDSEDSNEKKKLSITSLASAVGGVPTATILQYAAAVAPAGFFLCDGSDVSRTTYADLFTLIGTTYGVGDGSTTFTLPDLRQRFPLGKAAAGTGSVLGETGGAIDHDHDVPGHYHGMGTGADLNITSSGSHTHTINHGHTAVASIDGGHTHSIDHNHASVNTSSDGDHFHYTAVSGLAINTDPTVAGSNTRTMNTSFDASGGSLDYSYDLRGGASTANRNRTNTDGAHTHTVDLPNFTGTSGSHVGHDHSITVNAHSGSSGANSHTHALGDFAGRIGLVTGGEDGNADMITTTNNPPYIALNFIIKF